MRMGKLTALLTICAIMGTTAGTLHTSAETVKSSLSVGDLDCNGMVNSADAVLILQAAARFGVSGDYGLTTAQKTIADVNQDKLINSKDAWEILSYAAYAGTTSSKVDVMEFVKSHNQGNTVPEASAALHEEPLILPSELPPVSLTETETDPVEYYFDPEEDTMIEEPITLPTALVTEPPATETDPVEYYFDPTEDPIEETIAIPFPVATEPVQVTTLPQYQPVTQPPTEFHFELPTAPAANTVEGVFLGVKDWGASGTTFANAYNFRYRFNVNGSEVLYTVSNAQKGDMEFPIQNQLKVNYRFRLTLNGDQITDVEEIESGLPSYTPPVSGTPGVLTVRNLLMTAMEPVGTTLYMFGGGWNWQDGKYASGAAADAVSGWQTRKIGVQSDWVRFFMEHDQSYTYRTNSKTTTYYPYGEFNQYYYAGLDCSGFVGWVLYNTLETQDGMPGYVTKSTQMAKQLANRGWGTWNHSVNSSTKLNPGDIMSMNGHVWLSLGTCSDGSIVMVHSTPSDSYAGQPGGGVQIGAVGNSTSCQAYQLASRYMNRFYPGWCARYKVTLKSKSDYLSASASSCGSFSWNGSYPLTDPEGIRNMSADQALYMIFGE